MPAAIPPDDERLVARQPLDEVETCGARDRDGRGEGVR
jgi:hypothetical protein